MLEEELVKKEELLVGSLIQSFQFEDESHHPRPQ